MRALGLVVGTKEHRLAGSCDAGGASGLPVQTEINSQLNPSLLPYLMSRG